MIFFFNHVTLNKQRNIFGAAFSEINRPPLHACCYGYVSMCVRMYKKKKKNVVPLLN